MSDRPLKRRALRSNKLVDDEQSPSPRSPKARKQTGTPKSGQEPNKLYPDLEKFYLDESSDLDTTENGDKTDEEGDKVDFKDLSPGNGKIKPASPKVHKDQQKQKVDQPNSCLVFVVVLVLISTCILVSLFLSQKPPANMAAVPRTSNYFELFKNKLENVKKQYPSQTSKFWRVAHSQLRRVLSDDPDYPAILLVAVAKDGGTSALCFGKHLVKAVNSVFELSTDPVINAAELTRSSPAETKLELDQRLQRALDAGKGVVLDHIERLPSEAALLLHGYCDGDNAPYKQAVIVLLLHTNQDFADLDPGTVEERLTEIWGVGLGSDEMPALRSRIANNIMIVKPEAGISC